jgi:nitrile hydratase
VSEPRAVLAEFGTHIPGDVEIRVSDSTAIVRYLVLPRRPDGTENHTEEELAALVTRDAMIGVIPVVLGAEESSP